MPAYISSLAATDLSQGLYQLEAELRAVSRNLALYKELPKPTHFRPPLDFEGTTPKPPPNSQHQTASSDPSAMDSPKHTPSVSLSDSDFSMDEGSRTPSPIRAPSGNSEMESSSTPVPAKEPEPVPLMSIRVVRESDRVSPQALFKQQWVQPTTERRIRQALDTESQYPRSCCRLCSFQGDIDTVHDHIRRHYTRLYCICGEHSGSWARISEHIRSRKTKSCSKKVHEVDADSYSTFICATNWDSTPPFPLGQPLRDDLPERRERKAPSSPRVTWKLDKESSPPPSGRSPSTRTRR